MAAPAQKKTALGRLLCAALGQMEEKKAGGTLPSKSVLSIWPLDSMPGFFMNVPLQQRGQSYRLHLNLSSTTCYPCAFEQTSISLCLGFPIYKMGEYSYLPTLSWGLCTSKISKEVLNQCKLLLLVFPNHL